MIRIQVDFKPGSNKHVILKSELLNESHGYLGVMKKQMMKGWFVFVLTFMERCKQIFIDQFVSHMIATVDWSILIND
jgi:hypothetical protein